MSYFAISMWICAVMFGWSLYELGSAPFSNLWVQLGMTMLLTLCFIPFTVLAILTTWAAHKEININDER